MLGSSLLHGSTDVDDGWFPLSVPAPTRHDKLARHMTKRKVNNVVVPFIVAEHPDAAAITTFRQR